MEDNSTFLTCSTNKHSINFLPHVLPPHTHTRPHAHSFENILHAHKHAYMHPHAHAHAHNETPSGFDFPFIEQASSALLPLVLVAALSWVTVSLRRAPRGKDKAEGEWVRPLHSLAEVVSAVGALFGSLNMAQVLWLTSPHPITHHHLHHALTYLMPRLEALRLVVAWRRLWPWFRRPPRVDIDLAVLEGDPLVLCDQLLNSPYNMAAGPLWRFRLVPLPQQSPGQHRAALLFSAHHSLADGATIMLFVKDLLHALNAAAVGRVPCVPHRPHIHTLKQRGATPRGVLGTFTFVLGAIRTAATTAFSSCSLNSHLPPAKAGQLETRLLHHDFSEEVTEQLLAQCRGAGVRVHSCITTAASLALHRTAQHFAGRRLQPLEVIQEHMVNMRRYLDQQDEATGSMVIVMLQRFPVHDNPEAFWPLASEMQANLEQRLKQRRSPLRSGALVWLLSLIVPINAILSRLGFPNLNYAHISYSYMGDLRRVLGPAEDPKDAPVQLCGVLRTMSNELLGSLCSVNCHTLDGRLSLTFDYMPNKISEAAAKVMFSHLTHALTRLAASGTPSPPPSTRGFNTNG